MTNILDRLGLFFINRPLSKNAKTVQLKSTSEKRRPHIPPSILHDDEYPPYFDEDWPGGYVESAYCSACGEPHAVVRPGKTQPNCDCELICEHCGKKTIEYHSEEDSRWPNIFGWFCSKCGPFGDSTPDDNYTRITAEVNEHLNEIGMFTGDYSLYRVTGFVIGDDDYYYEAVDCLGVIHHHTCVGGFIWMKPIVSEWDYERMEDYFRLNKEFQDKVKKSLDSDKNG